MPRLLSLFDGTGSICKPFREAGWEVQSLDVDGRFGATLVEDILQCCDLFRLLQPWFSKFAEKFRKCS